MVRNIFMKSRTVRRLLSIAVICTFLSNGMAWGALQPPLSKVPVPVPRTNVELSQPQFSGPNGLASFIKDVPAAIQLGKALFWDMQVGSDGATACATCHFNAGADNRLKNQLHPGPDGIFANLSTALGKRTFGPNYTLKTNLFPLGDFPFFQINPVEGRVGKDTVQKLDPITGLPVVDPLTGQPVPPAIITRNLDDVAGSQGVRLADFVAINEGSALDSGTPIADQLFHVSSTTPNVDPANNVRRVTKRNAPSVINAVFNYTNFWDGRANNIFNGVNPSGPLDQNAHIFVDNGAALVELTVSIPNASLASQATAPPLDHTKMSFNGRTFPEVGWKMLKLIPLGLQQVHPNDSVLGGLVNGNNKGLNTSYEQMIKAAFKFNLTSNKPVSLPTKPDGTPFTQIEANFSLFWGLAIQLYEATLVSDRTPFDLFQLGNQNAMKFSAQKGLTTFDSKCAICHSGSEFTSAAVGSNPPNCVVTIAAPNSCNPLVFTNISTHDLIKQGLQNDAFLPVGAAVPIVTSDKGFFNIGVRPTTDDLGRGGTAPASLINPLDIDQATGNPKPFPLSFTLLAVLQASGKLPAEITVPRLPPLVPVNQDVAVLGAFKVPGLRNVELTAPYFHNGSAFTLLEVVEFYTRGGNFPQNPAFAAALRPIGNLRGDPVGRQDVADFLVALTDDRVRNQSAPFDHPELLIPKPENNLTMTTIPPTGGAPAAVAPGLTLDPVVTPILLTSQVISGMISDAAKGTTTVAVKVNGGPAAVATVKCVPDAAGINCVATNTWSFTATGLKVGDNTIEVTATDVTSDGSVNDVGVETVASPTPIQVLPTATIIGAPLGGSTKQNSADLTIAGSGVDTYQYSLDGGPFIAVDSVATHIKLSGLLDGIHTVAVIGKNTASNLQQPATSPTTATWSVKANPPVLTLNPVPSQAKGSKLTISGTVLQGSLSSVTVDTGANANVVQSISGGNSTWSCEITGLAKGVNNITLTALDNVFNPATKSTSITIVTPDGKIKGTGAVDISDALKALQIAVGIVTPSPDDQLHGDVAPLLNGVPDPNDIIDVADAIVILKKAVGLVNF